MPLVESDRMPNDWNVDDKSHFVSTVKVGHSNGCSGLMISPVTWAFSHFHTQQWSSMTAGTLGITFSRCLNKKEAERMEIKSPSTYASCLSLS